MFGMGFMEIMLIAIIAVIALGPEKLPSAMVNMAKMFKKIKSGVDDAKSSLDNELNITKMKDEADKLKAQLSYSTDTLNSGLDNILNDDEIKNDKAEVEAEIKEPVKKKKTKVSFKDTKTTDNNKNKDV
jgi:sec-independent protein translocase protein TatB